MDDARLRRLLDDPEAFLADPDPVTRRLAVSAAADRTGEAALRDGITAALESDPDERVRAEAAEVLAGSGPAALASLIAALDDPSPTVIEAAVTGLGELRDHGAVESLLAIASRAGDKMVIEAAVAALGAIGDIRAVPVLLHLVAAGSPQVRRRCVVALSVFDGVEVEAALLAARSDRNPMVREAAEMVVGRAP